MKKKSMLFALLLWASMAGFAQITDPFFEKTTYIGAFGTTDWTQGWANWNPQTTVYPAPSVTIGDGSTDPSSSSTNEITSDFRFASSASPVIGAASFTNSRLQDPFFEVVGYVGAFGTYDWTQGWANFDPQSTVYPATDVTIPAGHITSDQHWTASHTYLLDGWVYIDNNVTVTVDAGTVIRGSKVNQGALIVERGGKLIANGTVSQPIVFTSNVAAGSRTYGDWGGVILCGRSQINQPGGTAIIEGGVGSTFGGGSNYDLNDNSGVLRYVRIEFPGIAFSANNEINGLTMGGVGAGTTLDYIQVSYSGDDSYEWFGGTVNAKHLIAYRGLDDDFDTDNGYVGKVQFGVSLRDPAVADISESNGFESDNDASGSTNTPITMPIFSNISIFGPAVTSGTSINSYYKNAMQIRRRSACSIYNSTFSGYPYGLNIDGPSQIQANNGLLQIENVYLTGMVTNNFRAQNPSTGLNWTDTDVANFFNDPSKHNATFTNNTDLLLQDPFNLTDPDFLASKTTYKIDGFVFVRSGATVTIDPGVIIRGDKTHKSSLIIERGAKIIANGTANEPIVFTSNEAAGSRTYGDWGGLILCGNSAINLPNGVATIEGSVGSLFGGGLTPDVNDNSGVLKYVRIEFPGYAFTPNNEINGLTMGGVGAGTTIDHVQVSYSNDDSYEWFGGTVNCKHLIAFRGLDDDFDTDNGFSGHVQFGVSLRDPSVADVVSGSNSFESDNDATGSTSTPFTNATFSNISSFGPNPAVNPGYNTSYLRSMHLRRSTKIDIYNTILLGWPTGLMIDGVNTQAYADGGDLNINNSFMAGMPVNFAVPSGQTWTVQNESDWFLNSARNNNTYTNSSDLQIADGFNLTAPNFLPASTSPVWGASIWSRTISGRLLYAKATTPAAVSNSTVYLKNSTGNTTLASATTNASGNFTLYAVDGNYTLDADVNKPAGGLSIVDAVQVRRQIANLTTFDALQLLAGDVNVNGSVDISDAAFIRRKLSNQATPLQWQIKNFVFSKPSVSISGSGVTQDITVLSGGDVDRSYTPAVN